MVTQDLLDYIKGERAHGETRQAITDVLLKEGWTLADINAACEQISPSSKPAPIHLEPEPPVQLPPLSHESPVQTAAMEPTPASPVFVSNRLAADSPFKVPTHLKTINVMPIGGRTPVVSDPEAISAKPVVPVNSLARAPQSAEPVRSQPLLVPPVVPVAPIHARVTATTPAADEPAPVTPSPVYVTSPTQRSSNRSTTALLLLLLVLLVGGAGYGYTHGAFSFLRRAPFGEDTLLQSLAKAFASIQSSSYKATISLASEARETGAAPLSLLAPAGAVLPYSRDEERLKGLQDRALALESYFTVHKSYPAQLSDLVSDSGGAASSDYWYTLAPGGKEFTLRTVLETQEAVDRVVASHGGAGLAVSGTTLTINKSTPPYFVVALTPSDPVLAPFVDIQNEVAYFPADLNVAASLLGTGSATGGTGDARVAVDVKLSTASTQAALLGEARKVGNDFFVDIQKAPDFLGFGAVTNHWVKITPNDIVPGTGRLGVDPLAFEHVFENQQKIISNELSTFLAIADKHHALRIVGSPVHETIEGLDLFTYRLELNPDTIPTFYEELATTFAKQFGDQSPIAFSAQVASYLKSDDWKKVLAYFNQNTQFSISVDANGTPRLITYAVRIVPAASATALANKQFRLAFAMRLDDINVPVTVAVPSPLITYEDAVVLESGLSRVDYEYSRQRSTIIALRDLILLYKTYTGRYPASLDELRSTPRAISEKFGVPLPSVSSLSATHLDEPLALSIPLDLYTKEPFTYSSSGSDYTLGYTMVIPPHGSAVADTYFHRPSNGNQFEKRFVVDFVSGINTADSKTLSREAGFESKKDTDKDGIPDVLEAYFGTDSTKKDSDGDKKSDFDEALSNEVPAATAHIH